MEIYCVQPDLAWHDAAANRSTCEAMIRDAAPEKGSLVVLPETVASGFTGDVAAGTDSPANATADWMLALAGDLGISLIGGLITTGPDGRGRNEAVVCAAGRTHRYAKQHTFALGEERRTFTQGNAALRLDVGGFRTMPRVCYDLRFPEDFRDGATELYVVIANWPAARQAHWHALLRARAIENQAFVCGVNRVGRDPNVGYAGGSAVYDFDGRTLLELDDRPAVAGVSLDLDALRRYRLKLPFLADFLGRPRAE